MRTSLRSAKGIVSFWRNVAATTGERAQTRERNRFVRRKSPSSLMGQRGGPFRSARAEKKFPVGKQEPHEGGDEFPLRGSKQCRRKAELQGGPIFPRKPRKLLRRKQDRG